MASKKELPIAVQYKGENICLIEDDDDKEKTCKRLLTQARSKLFEVFKTKTSNIKLANIFVSRSFIGSDDAEKILNPGNLTLQEWSTEFCNLLSNSDSVAEGITLLCNLDEDDFKTYRNKIQIAFKNIDDVELIDKKAVVETSVNPPTSQSASQAARLLLKNQNEFIDQHLDDIIDNTVWSPRFVSKFVSKGLLDKGERAILEGISNPQEKCSKLFEILQTKAGYFEKLTEVFAETNQTIAVGILEEFTP